MAFRIYDMKSDELLYKSMVFEDIMHLGDDNNVLVIIGVTGRIQWPILFKHVELYNCKSLELFLHDGTMVNITRSKFILNIVRPAKQAPVISIKVAEYADIVMLYNVNCYLVGPPPRLMDISSKTAADINFWGHTHRVTDANQVNLGLRPCYRDSLIYKHTGSGVEVLKLPLGANIFVHRALRHIIHKCMKFNRPQRVYRFKMARYHRIRL